MFDTKSQNRRDFLRNSGLMALSSSALPFALNLVAVGEAAAFNTNNPPGDYKALVCVLLDGGNDYGNTLIPYDLPNYKAYNNIRSGRTGDALDRSGVALAFDELSGTVLAPDLADVLKDSRVFALNPAMTELKDLFQAGSMAIQLNVGPLVEPITRAQFDDNKRTQKLPPNLMDHDTQKIQWHSPSSKVEKYGWGGHVSDLMKDKMVNAADNAAFTCVSVHNNTVLLAGEKALQYQLDQYKGAINIGPANSPYELTDVGTALAELIQNTAGTHTLENEYNAMTKRAIKAELAVKEALKDNGFSTTVTVTFPDTELGRQLKMVARLIHGRGKLGATAPTRQIFFVQIGGFDMHDGLMDQHPKRLGDLSKSLHAFYKATEQMSLKDNVTSFTASDFGRTLALNGGGSDHGWGSHHFVVGGNVNGKKFYGVPPPVSAGNTKVAGAYAKQDQWHIGAGRLLPTTSVDQYAGTLAKWFGVDDTEIDTIFPNLKNFVGLKNEIPYSKDMGFMKA